MDYSAPRLYIGSGTVERAIRRLKNLIVANMEDNLCLTDCVNRALNVT